MAGRINGQGSNWIRRTTRFAIYHRDGFRCVYCLSGAEDAHGSGLTLDHVVPGTSGGTNDPTNLVTCCGACNSAKKDRTPRQWYAYLRGRAVRTRVIAQRVRRHLQRPIDRVEGRRLVAMRRAA